MDDFTKLENLEKYFKEINCYKKLGLRYVSFK